MRILRDILHKLSQTCCYEGYFYSSQKRSWWRYCKGCKCCSRGRPQTGVIQSRRQKETAHILHFLSVNCTYLSSLSYKTSQILSNSTQQVCTHKLLIINNSTTISFLPYLPTANYRKARIFCRFAWIPIDLFENTFYQIFTSFFPDALHQQW